MSDKCPTAIDQGKASAIAAVRSTAELGRLLGISRSAVAQWQKIPPERVLEVERVTGVPRHVLRPDLYPVDGYISSSPFPTEAEA